MARHRREGTTKTTGIDVGRGAGGVSGRLVVPLDELGDAFTKRCLRVVAEQLARLADVGASARDITRLFWQDINNSLATGVLLDQPDEVVEPRRPPVPEVVDLVA